MCTEIIFSDKPEAYADSVVTLADVLGTTTDEIAACSHILDGEREEISSPDSCLCPINCFEVATKFGYACVQDMDRNAGGYCFDKVPA